MICLVLLAMGFVLVVGRLMALLTRAIAQRLEGSRFGACFVALANSFHHEPGPNVRQQAAPGNDPAACSATGWIETNRKRRLVRCIALGDSREPPVATFFGRMERWNEYREVVWYTPKRLPSGRWEQIRLVNLPTVSRTTTTRTKLTRPARPSGRRAEQVGCERLIQD